MMMFMDNFYEQMKCDIGVDPDYAIDHDDPELDSAIKKLRPDCTVSFRQYIKKEHDDDVAASAGDKVIQNCSAH
jgi:hypothetical protein